MCNKNSTVDLWLFHCHRLRFLDIRARSSPRFIYLLIRLDWLSASIRSIYLAGGHRETVSRPIARNSFLDVINRPKKQSCKLSQRSSVFGSSVQYRASLWPRENWKENKSTILVINWLNMERQKRVKPHVNNEALKKIINNRFVLFNIQTSGLKAKKTVDE